MELCRWIGAQNRSQPWGNGRNLWEAVQGHGEQRDSEAREEDGVAVQRHVRLPARAQLAGAHHAGRRKSKKELLRPPDSVDSMWADGECSNHEAANSGVMNNRLLFSSQQKIFVIAALD